MYWLSNMNFSFLFLPSLPLSLFSLLLPPSWTRSSYVVQTDFKMSYPPASVSWILGHRHVPLCIFFVTVFLSSSFEHLQGTIVLVICRLHDLCVFNITITQKIYACLSGNFLRGKWKHADLHLQPCPLLLNLISTSWVGPGVTILISWLHSCPNTCCCNKSHAMIGGTARGTNMQAIPLVLIKAIFSHRVHHTHRSIGKKRVPVGPKWYYTHDKSCFMNAGAWGRNCMRCCLLGTWFVE